MTIEQLEQIKRYQQLLESGNASLAELKEFRLLLTQLNQSTPKEAPQHPRNTDIS